MKFVKVGILMVILLAPVTYSQSIFSANHLGEINVIPGGRSIGMGGVGVGLWDPLTINRLNPGTWTAVDITRINLTSSYESVIVSAADGSRKSVDTNFGGIQFLIPLHKRLVMAAGFLPFTHSKYDWALQGSTSSFAYSERIEASGGINDFQIGFAYRIDPKWSLGFSGDYFFGKLQNISAFSFSGIRSSDTKITNRVFGWSGTVGLLSTAIPEWSLGAALRIPVTLSTHQDTTYISTATSLTSFHTIKIPFQFSLGAFHQFSNKWSAGMDLIYSNWKSGYQIDSRTPGDARDLIRLGSGAEYAGSKDPFAPFLQKLSYRAGFYYQQWYYQPQGNPLNDVFLTAGIGIPFAKQANRFDLALEYGWRGNIDKTGAQEKIIRISASISAGERWFQRSIE
jgi:hypothetical protein